MKYKVEAIIGRRYERKRLQYLIKWENYSIEQSTWEPLKNLGDVMDMIEKFQQQNKRKKQILIVSIEQKTNTKNKENTNNNNENDEKEEFQFESQFQKQDSEEQKNHEDEQLKKIEKKYWQQKNINKKRREREKKKKLKQLGIQVEQQGTSKNENGQILVQIIKMATKDNKTYFKLLCNGEITWRNRDYLAQFHPKVLCEYYQSLLLAKYG